MRLVTVRTPDGTRAALVEGDELSLTDHVDVGELLRSGHTPTPAPTPTGERMPLAGAELAPVVPTPGKIICVGLNYAAHIREMGRDLPTHPTLFAKYPEALVGPTDPIQLPSVSTQMDWEAELAVVIGTTVRQADEATARASIAGYTVINDVTARDWQYRTLQWLQGKTFESTAPLGPQLVTPDEIDHAADLEIRCEVDGVVEQRSRTSDLVFGPVDLVRYVSTIVTLQPGDIIATGTPGGVGAAAEPPRFLRPGQVVRTTIEGIGILDNVCVAT